jgi:NTP pyrophosphatase (non-canonical NTP hydrolase)
MADFLDDLQRLAENRTIEWTDGQGTDLLFRATELGGEVGEVLNVCKKLHREEQGWRGSRTTQRNLEDECADVLICLAMVATKRGINLVEVTRRKFNETSEAVGLPHRL